MPLHALFRILRYANLRTRQSGRSVGLVLEQRLRFQSLKPSTVGNSNMGRTVGQVKPLSGFLAVNLDQGKVLGVLRTTVDLI